MKKIFKKVEVEAFLMKRIKEVLLKMTVLKLN